MSRRLAWSAVLILTAIVTAITLVESLEAYVDLRSGWSWDLAYYNQWFWALTRGDRILSVRPLAAYATEGPSVWQMNYVAPIRFAIIPLYVLFPDPRTLLVVQEVVFWWCLPAAFGLVLSETRSTLAGLSAFALVLLTPLLWPLAANDFRELQLALPFVIWAIQGIRGRSVWLAAIGIGGMLACRQEFALMVASFSIVPPRKPEGIEPRYRWTRGLLGLGLGWFLVGFLGYLYLFISKTGPTQYVMEFGGRSPTIGQILTTSAEFLFVGMGTWALLMMLAPRLALLALPWVLSLSKGRWALGFIGTEQWHHVRYAAPMAAIVLAAGLVGYARAWNIARKVGVSGWLMAGAWLVAAAGLVLAKREVDSRLDRIPRPIARSEAAELWRWIDRVGPDDGVLAHYDVTAPLSSRRKLYSYVLLPNWPKGYPFDLPPEIGWVFLRGKDIKSQILADQGFRELYTGKHIRVFRRGGVGSGTQADDPPR